MWPYLFFAATQYVAVFYGFENWRNAAAYSHSFGSFYRIDDSGEALRVDISWIPQDAYMPPPGDLRMPALGDWPGQNVSVPVTIQRSLQAIPARSVTTFGPYPIDGALFDAQLARSRQLFSGQITYRGIDLASRPYSLNCVHALSDACGDFRTGVALRGPTASWGLVRFCAEQGLVTSLQPRNDLWSVLDRSVRIGCDPRRTDLSRDCR